ncbi:tRNA pseudouridine synthase-like 1 [Aulostomus maculatus]
MHSCARYLIFFQYIGTKYRGAAKVSRNQVSLKGVQDHIEEAITKLRPVNPVSLTISSRTDAGVHAFSNSAHFDLQRKGDKPPFTVDCLVASLNYHLNTEQIRITHAYRVPPDFHARHCAQSRTYVYRIGLGARSYSNFPLPEQDLCWSLSYTHLDVEAMREAASMLVGIHDFSSFMAKGSDPVSPVKEMEVARIQPGLSFVNTHFHREHPFLELVFKSKSFLYRQVRRMTGALVAVGKGKLSLPEMKEILDARDSLAFPESTTAPAKGLFLTRVEYKESDLCFPEQTPHLPSSGDSD